MKDMLSSKEMWFEVSSMGAEWLQISQKLAQNGVVMLAQADAAI